MVDESELRNWWLAQADGEIAAMVPKAVEYSAVDLEIMGAAMEAMGAAGEGDGVEAAIAFYALGKLSRIAGALAEGRTPNRDSWFDLGVYARMAQRVIEVGSWPGQHPELEKVEAPQPGPSRVTGDDQPICGVAFSDEHGHHQCVLPPHPPESNHWGPVVAERGGY